LAVDILVALLVVGVGGGAMEWWIRRRGGLFRFRILDMLATVTVFGVLLGWYEHHARTQRFEHQGATPPVPPAFLSHDGKMTSGQRYSGPDWMRRLAGNVHLLPFLHHIYNVSVRPDEAWRPMFESLPMLPYLESVRIDGALPLEALEQLETCPWLKSLELPRLDSHAARVMSGSDEPLFGVGDFAELQRLHLTELELGGDAVLADDIETVAAFADLKKLSLRSVSATLDEIDAIRERHPDIGITATWQYAHFIYNKPPPGHDTIVEKAQLSRQNER
jgi:hypothetical protein